MAMERFVVMSRDVAARKVLFDPGEELRVDSHQVFALTMDGALLHHPDLAVTLDNLSFDLADLLTNQVGPVFLASKDRFARLMHATRAQRIGRSRPAQRGLALLVGFQQRLIRPFRRE